MLTSRKCIFQRNTNWIPCSAAGAFADQTRTRGYLDGAWIEKTVRLKLSNIEHRLADQTCELRFSVPDSQSLYVLAKTFGVWLWLILLRFNVVALKFFDVGEEHILKLDCRFTFGRTS
uniref:Uncharacterized protein n=1 Tax=Glossina pallidipes TaxID=7398 RepID=A0A1A9ZKN0_GLOPL